MRTISLHRSSFIRTASILAVTGVASLGSVAHADGALGDVWISSLNGTLITGGFDHTTGTVINPSQRVFAADFGIDPAFPFSTDEPGFTSDLLGSTVTINLLQGLGRWNGAGFDAATSSLFASYGGQDATSTAGGSFGFLVTAGLDLHPEFTLVDPLDGVYLASFTASSAGYATSESFYVLFNLGESEIDHDEAIEWVEANIVPAPGALALLGAGLLVLRRRR
jgi:uncharacterized protein (TIGR03382 family)